MTLRQKVYAKYNGKCAYTGKPLGDDWQIDHVMPKRYHGDNSLENLVPSLKIINHYKRCQTLEQFRKYISGLQSRIEKLPRWINSYKKPDIPFVAVSRGAFSYRDSSMEAQIERRKYLKYKRAEYIKIVAALFGITSETPFGGKFFFEEASCK